VAEFLSKCAAFRKLLRELRQKSGRVEAFMDRSPERRDAREEAREAIRRHHAHCTDRRGMATSVEFEPTAALRGARVSSDAPHARSLSIGMRQSVLEFSE